MKNILVVVDMQNDFLTGALGNKECEATIAPVVEIINSGKYDIFYATKDTHYENYLDTQEGKKLPVVHCIKGTDGWEINKTVDEALKKAAKEKNTEVNYVCKETFGSLELANMIKNEGEAKELCIDFVGVCTGICVISNVLATKACVPEATINVISKACACVTPDTHNTALEAMKTCQIDVIQ